MSTMRIDADVIAAAIEAYTPEGVVRFLTNWMWADPKRRARMEAGVKAEWSVVSLHRVPQRAGTPIDRSVGDRAGRGGVPSRRVPGSRRVPSREA